MRASADEQGRYRLINLSAGTFVLRAVADGYAAGTQSVTLSASQTLDFALDPSSTPAPPPATERFTLSGSVSDSRNEAAIRGARVSVVTGPDRGASTETDDAGRYSLSVQPASFRLEVSAPSFATEARNVTVSANHVVDFELRAESSPGPSPSGTVVRGTTLNGVSSQPIAGARVRIDSDGAAQEATSRSDGAFEVTLSSPRSRVSGHRVVGVQRRARDPRARRERAGHAHADSEVDQSGGLQSDVPRVTVSCDAGPLPRRLSSSAASCSSAISTRPVSSRRPQR